MMKSGKVKSTNLDLLKEKSMLNRTRNNMFKKLYKKFDFVNQFQFDRISRWAGLIGIFIPIISMIRNGYCLITLLYCFFIISILLLLLKVELGKIVYIWSLFVGSPINTKLYLNSAFFEKEDQEAIAECMDWLRESINPNYYMFKRNGIILFLFKKDAMYFKLTWGGHPAITLKK